MKSFKYSIIIFLSILIICVSSNVYVKKQISVFKNSFSQYNSSPAEIEILKNNFYKNKNMLRLFINKEHIRELETSILLYENYNAAGDISGCKELMIETMCLLSQIEEYITAIY